MASFKFDVNDFEASIEELMLRVHKATRDASLEAGLLVESNAKRNFTGPPGPTTRTGTLRRSIQTTSLPTSEYSWRTEIAPTVIYGRRVELGFVGTDSLGRHYAPPKNPAKYPYLRPGFEKALPVIPRIFRDAWQAAMGG